MNATVEHWDSAAHLRLSLALTYAVEAHGNQRRKGTDVPYVSHLLGVCSLVLEAGGSPDEAIAALLHDAIEDAGVTREEICDRFGESVAEIVSGCSDTDAVPKPPWRERKVAYIERLAMEGEGVWLVSLADKVHNARATLADYRALGDELWGRFNAGRDDQLWYYQQLAEQFKRLRPGPLADELSNLASELERESADKGF